MKDNIRGFIEKNLEKEPRKMCSSLFLVNFFPMLGVAFGLILGGIYRVFSVLITFLICISFVLLAILTKKHNVIRTIKASMCFNMSTAVNYLLFAMILYSMYNKLQFSLILLSFPLVLVALLTTLCTVHFLKKGGATPSKRKKDSIASIAGATFAVTYLILKRSNIHIEQNLALLIGTVLLILMSSLFIALGVLDVIKLYYIKKFNITFEK